MLELNGLEAGQVALLGVPWDAHSSFLRGPALAPRQIRAALHSGAMNLCAENGYDLGADARWHDLGDLAIPAGDEAALAAITGTASAVLRRGGRLAGTRPRDTFRWPSRPARERPASHKRQTWTR